MRVILFGGTGMLGGGVLRECLADADVTRVVSAGRAGVELTHPKLRQIVTRDLFALESLGSALDGFDVCLYCLGPTSVGATEASYRRITRDLTVSIGETLLRHNTALRFLFISGRGADSAGTSRQMWARVKGEAENAILAMPFADVYVFRPGVVQPVHGTASRTAWIRAAYKLTGPLMSLLRWAAPRSVSTTEELGKAMLRTAKYGFPKKILEASDFRDAVGPDTNRG
ncbi:MAG TPA: epimerase [Bryobacteraceae bacterium]|nr:epimerase [Bryobacteraceae bacterium]